MNQFKKRLGLAAVVSLFALAPAAHEHQSSLTLSYPLSYPHKIPIESIANR